MIRSLTCPLAQSITRPVTEIRGPFLPPIAVPGAPTGVTATAGNAQATVSWSAPASVGGGPITGYRITASTGQTLTVGAVLTGTVTGLANGTPVTFTVAAQNAGGYGPESAASVSVTPTAIGPEQIVDADMDLVGYGTTGWVSSVADEGGNPGNFVDDGAGGYHMSCAGINTTDTYWRTTPSPALVNGATYRLEVTTIGQVIDGSGGPTQPLGIKVGNTLYRHDTTATGSTDEYTSIQTVTAGPGPNVVVQAHSGSGSGLFATVKRLSLKRLS